MYLNLSKVCRNNRPQHRRATNRGKPPLPSSHECSPVNLLHISRTHFLKNTSGGVILEHLFHRTYFALLLLKCTCPEAFTIFSETYVLTSVVKLYFTEQNAMCSLSIPVNWTTVNHMSFPVNIRNHLYSNFKNHLRSSQQRGVLKKSLS